MKHKTTILLSFVFALGAHAASSSTPDGVTQSSADKTASPGATLEFAAQNGKSETARFSIAAESGGLRTYEQASSMRMRDDAPSSIRYAEIAGQPTVRSGSLALDALFAHAIVEMKQNSVSAIRDDAYNDGKPIACECFETGEKWHYVWTRDLSYAAHLGLAMFDPQRARNSLEFKLSGYRAGSAKAPGVEGSEGGLQIIQDTGSGGSWPVSTDRVSWAFGAARTLDALPPAQRAAFSPRVFEALANTIENDRLAAFDMRDGLYAGEQSFLDWREQSYGADIANELTRLASAKALSTNVAHYKALSLAAQLALELGQKKPASRYQQWAAQLKQAINARFWLEDAGMYGSLTAAHFDGAAQYKFDWLGLSLAIVTGVADASKTERILASYPHGPVGAPVIYPQQRGVPIYHNRAIWPFVTAYGLDAAIVGRNVSVADAAYSSLVRGAALHLSNMENMEWITGSAQFDDSKDASLSGPVINSRRQLWSVGAYLGMVVRNVFGLSLSSDGISVQPFITTKLRRDLFATSKLITLDGFALQGKQIKLQVVLPAAIDADNADAYFAVESITLNGLAASPQMPWTKLKQNNLIVVQLGKLLPGTQKIRLVGTPQEQATDASFAPFEAQVARVTRRSQGQIDVEIKDDKNPPESVYYQIYRNGRLVADHLLAPSWSDHVTMDGASFYSVVAVSTSSGNRSHHSAAVSADKGTLIDIPDARISSNLSPIGTTAHIANWGAPTDRFTVKNIEILNGGRHAFQLRYTNHGHAINTGISNGVKLLIIYGANGKEVARRVIQMPHLPMESAALYSTPADIDLVRGTYRLELSDYYNMSYLSSNSIYGAGGGKTGPLNRVDLYGVRIMRMGSAAP